MIKLTELKRMIKANNLNPCFYAEGLNNVIFNYKQQLTIILKQIDQPKLFAYLQSTNYVSADLKFTPYNLDMDLKNKFERITANKLEHTQMLVDTGIQFHKKGKWKDEEKILYKVFKTEKGLMKIKDEYICMLNQDIKKGVVLKTNEAHSMIFIYNNTNDIIGVCVGEKFEMSELTEYTQWGS